MHTSTSSAAAAFTPVSPSADHESANSLLQAFTNADYFKFRKSTVDPLRAAILRSQIEAFHIEYCAVLDNLLIEQWPDFFTADAGYRITARENAELGLPVGLVYCEGKNMMRDRAVAIARTQMFAPRYSLHLVANTRIIAENKGRGGSVIAAQANFIALQTLVEGATTIHLAGSYFDQFWQGEDSTLLLRDRQVVYDTTIIANDLVYPI